jgi:hypothetical protein
LETINWVIEFLSFRERSMKNDEREIFPRVRY